MDPSDWIAIGAAVIGGGALGVSWMAHRQAKDAADLQSRIDARQREFRDVSWEGIWDETIGPDDRPTFVLKNTGLTTAEGVVLVIDGPNHPQAYKLGTIEPAATGRAQVMTTDMRGPISAAMLQRDPLPFRVHWFSPLGQADDRSYPGGQLF